jgi:hypothetical protein
MKLRKILLTILLAVVVAINFSIMPIGGPLIWVPLVIDIVVILGVFLTSMWAVFKVGADSERGGKDE